MRKKKYYKHHRNTCLINEIPKYVHHIHTEINTICFMSTKWTKKWMNERGWNKHDNKKGNDNDKD